MKIHDISGNANLKRAMEVALSGNHSMAILETYNSVASDLQKAFSDMALENGLSFNCINSPVCNCKCYGTGNYECTCKIKSLEKHLKKQYNSIKEFDIVWESLEPQLYENLAIDNNEKEDVILDRIMTCINSSIIIDKELTTDCQCMLEYAVKEYPEMDLYRVIGVAGTICKMENRNFIEMCHLSEAIQYQRLVFKNWHIFDNVS